MVNNIKGYLFSCFYLLFCVGFILCLTYFDIKNSAGKMGEFTGFYDSEGVKINVGDYVFRSSRNEVLMNPWLVKYRSGIFFIEKTDDPTNKSSSDMSYSGLLRKPLYEFYERDLLLFRHVSVIIKPNSENLIVKVYDDG